VDPQIVSAIILAAAAVAAPLLGIWAQRRWSQSRTNADPDSVGTRRSESNETPNVVPRTDTRDKPNHMVDEQKPLPTFEIGTCTEGSPLEMECTGEIVGGLVAAKRVVEEIELDTNLSDPKRFDVRVAGIERLREHLLSMNEASGGDVEERHESRMALLDWEKHLNVFYSSVEFVLWTQVLRNTSHIWNTEHAAEAVCGLSEHCFSSPHFPVEWWLWYEGERQTLLVFGVTEDIEEYMRMGYYEDDFGSMPKSQGLDNYRAYTPLSFSPRVLNQYVLPQLLIFAAEKKAEGASQATLDQYLDVTRWRWSVSNPDKFVKW